MGKLNDLSLVTQVAVFHNKRAFDQLVKEYQSPVRRFFLNQTLGDGALSDDLAQDTFVKAYLNIASFRAVSSFSTWLFRIAYNVWYDHCRRARATVNLADVSAAVAATDERSAGSSLHVDIYRALALLREEERTCITLQLIDGYPIDQIAAITGMPQGTVKSHLWRGKDKLTKYLKANGYGDRQ